jgi:catechol-2,3-dioxygenase
VTARTLEPTLPAAEFAHVVLRTGHVAESIDFYETVLGMRRISGGEHGAALSHDGEHHRIALIGVPDAPRQPGPGLEHFAWKAQSLGDLLGNHKRITEAGIEPYLCIHHGGTLSIYYRDPDRNQIEVFIDTLTVDESIEYMGTERFAANPIGVPFDVDDLIRRYEAGEPMEGLLAQPEADPEAVEEMMDKVIAGMVGE